MNADQQRQLQENKKTILELQATLIKIKTKKQCFFNVANFKKFGLIREHGLTFDNRINWVLTQKAQAILNVQV